MDVIWQGINTHLLAPGLGFAGTTTVRITKISPVGLPGKYIGFKI
jgi:hypothetical protein